MIQVVTTDDLAFTPITVLAGLIVRKRVSSTEIVTALLQRVERLDPTLRAFITLRPEAALRAARRADREIADGRYLGPLHGIPIAHKDISWTRGILTTAHSRTLNNFVPDRDATHVRRLRRAGMILLGKTNLTEFAIGSAMELYGVTPNPWDLSRYTGGSSCR